MRSLIFSLVLCAAPVASFAEIEVFVDSASLDNAREHVVIGIHYCGDAGEIPFAIVGIGATSPDSAAGGGPTSKRHFKIQATNKILENGGIVGPHEECVRVVTKSILFNLKKLGLPTPSPDLYVYGNRETRMSTAGPF